MLRLKFVEINGNKTERIFLENKPSQVIGHDGDIKPKITNGHISRKHCTVVFNEATQNWTIVDGNLDKPSVNGLFDVAGNKIDGSGTLTDENSRIYLINVLANQAYLEVFDTEKVSLPPRRTAALEIQMDELSVKAEKAMVEAEEVKQVVVSTRAAIESNHVLLSDAKKSSDILEAKINLLMTTVDVGLNKVAEVGARPKIYLIGSTVGAVMIIMGILTFTIYQNIGAFVDLYLEPKGFQQTPKNK